MTTQNHRLKNHNLLVVAFTLSLFFSQILCLQIRPTSFRSNSFFVFLQRDRSLSKTIVQSWTKLVQQVRFFNKAKNDAQTPLKLICIFAFSVVLYLSISLFVIESFDKFFSTSVSFKSPFELIYVRHKTAGT